MTSNTFCPPAAMSHSDRLGALHTTDWLSLGAAPILGFMAALTAMLGDGPHAVPCSAGSHAWALSGMVPMYVLMSAFHVGPWFKLISRWRSGARASGLSHEART
jgi:hypothetical protein